MVFTLITRNEKFINQRYQTSTSVTKQLQIVVVVFAVVHMVKLSNLISYLVAYATNDYFGSFKGHVESVDVYFDASDEYFGWIFDNLRFW